MSKKEWSQAGDLLQQSVQLRKQAVGDKAATIAFMLDKLGMTLLQRHLPAQAGIALAEAERILESTYYAGHGYLARVLEHHADCLTEEGKLPNAEKLLERAQEIYAKTVTMQNQATLRCIYKLARLYLQEWKPAEAEAILEKAMKYVDTPLGPCAEFRYQLARAYASDAKFDEASKLLELSIAEFKQRHNHRRVADCLHAYAMLHGKPDKDRKGFNDEIDSEDIFLETLIRA